MQEGPRDIEWRRRQRHHVFESVSSAGAATYRKLWQVIADHGLGFQQVNRMADNLEAIRNAYALEHGLEARNRGVGLDSFGRHNLVQVPRSMVRITITDTNSPAPSVVASFVGPFVSNVSFRQVTDPLSSEIVSQALVDVSGLSKFWGKACSNSSVGVVAYFPRCRAVIEGGKPRLVITTYGAGVAALHALVPYSLNVAIYGY